MKTVDLKSYSREGSYVSFPDSQIPDGDTVHNTKKDIGTEENSCWTNSRCRRSVRRLCSKEQLEQVFPIIKWAPKYTKDMLVADLIAGLTVGLTILPQGLAYATVAGLPPQYGLYSGFVGCFVYIFLGGTKAITIGPTAIQMILVYKYTDGKPPEYATFLCFICGVVSLLIGIFRLGFIANFISLPVISGFTSAVAITIIGTQVKGLLGLKFSEEGFLPTVSATINHIHEVKQWDAIMSLVCCIFLLILMKIQAIFSCFTKPGGAADKSLWILSMSRNALAIIGGTILVLVLNDQPFTLVGHIRPGLPEFQSPPFSIFNPADNTTRSFMDLMREEASGIVVLPLLGIMGHITIAKAFAGATKVEPTQEILSIGVSNLISMFFQSMPISGSFSRTTVNAMSGVASPAGGLVTGIMVILGLQFLTPYFAFIPKASLAAVVCSSVAFMVDLTIIAPMWRSKKMDLIPWGVTTLVTLFIGLEYGILIGVVISGCFLLYYAARPRIKIMKGFTARGTEFILVELDRSLTFPSVDFTTETIGKAAVRWGNPSTPIVIDCHHIQFADFTAAQAFRDMVANFVDEGYRIYFWKVKASVLRIVDAVMVANHTQFIYCKTEEEMEALVDNGTTKGSISKPNNNSNVDNITEIL